MLILIAGCQRSPAPVIVGFPDPDLELAIRQRIGKHEGDIYDKDLVGLTFLSVLDRSIANLEGIQYCVDLTTLHLLDVETIYTLQGQIVDIRPLSGLTKLESLALMNNQIIDISPLSALTNLTKLNLSWNQIIDISPLSELTNLTQLSLWKNQIVDISPLSALTDLTQLNLWENQIVDISPLSELTSLELLFLRSNQIIDISPLSALTNLMDLYLSRNQIVDIEPLVSNAGIDSGDSVEISWNRLDLDSASQAMLDIQTLRQRGIYVEYEPQD